MTMAGSIRNLRVALSDPALETDGRERVDTAPDDGKWARDPLRRLHHVEGTATPPLARGDLSATVIELKNQLCEFIATSERLGQDLDVAQHHISVLTEERDQLKAFNHRLGRDMRHSEAVRERAAELEEGNRALVERLEDMSALLASSERRAGQLSGSLDRALEERATAHAQARDLDAQLSRAIRVIRGLHGDRVP